MDHYTWSQRAPRTPASLISGGVLLSLAAGFFHPDRAPANDHAAAFAEYAHSGAWIAVHLGQFVGMMVIVAGLLALFLVLNGQAGRSVWAGPFGAAAAVLALGLYGVLQAVDGVALKHAVDAWATAPGGAGGALRERRDDPMARAPITTASYRTGSGGGDTGAPGPLRVAHPA